MKRPINASYSHNPGLTLVYDDKTTEQLETEHVALLVCWSCHARLVLLKDKDRVFCAYCGEINEHRAQRALAFLPHTSFEAHKP